MILTNFRSLSSIDNLIIEFDTAMKVLTGTVIRKRTYKIADCTNNGSILTLQEQKISASIMRVNHSGEICAQALYRGQSFFCQDIYIKNVFLNAAEEEIDHLIWCKHRLCELNGHESYLNIFWYMGSFFIGLLMSLNNQKWNLGFMAETEKQVEHHLIKCLELLPNNDYTSKIILEQMKIDELIHKNTAEKYGGVVLPKFLTVIMKLSAKIMTTISYKI
ncbi:2-nonaprenyl-3-methyl-6-methoxy-1,4-benzoquinol hydroxylase [Candidatus Kinetoplastibacterium sorsogonicusi]|uniref:2-nonaprenyl-3-methyl-6-methoxy-1,4-benzoquinol hydroxylase n=1 Tax=Candidatus Kinetoplastidibacterium kentomonadis TaxID=1576550 RepID=A0A3S7J991_9PROT|nr:2-polyprenyl-3-methyl-6-methoxy-1,4-benzoquinone monooxygenase [Candidatus Kinetoplastibacterium sorsogonicusi]AWD32234.1 2-nonaprenyl-3-methyl-6-methoxy-1,4-benzoquinol hydroxylase [Candidatus Kinetoplastibacterium sorsogonicusi]